jgi:hypothetical protein
VLSAGGSGKEATVNNESPEDRQVMELWQNQETEGVRMSVEQVRLEAGRFQRKIKARNLREYVVALMVMVFFGFELSRTTQVLVRVGFGLLMAGMAYLVWYMLSKGSPGAADEKAGLSSWIEFQRRELVRQRDLLRSVWRWYLGPLVPGLVVLLAAFLRVSRSNLAIPVFMVTVYVLAVGAVFFGIGRLNARGAQKLQRQIDELDKQSQG